MLKWLLYLTCTIFLYISFGINELDTQPWAFCISCLILLNTLISKGKVVIPKQYYWLIVFLIIIPIFLIIDGVHPSSYRIIYFTLSFPIIFLATINVGEINYKAHKYIILIWYLGIIVQLLQPDIISYLIGEERNYTGVSFSSFSPEPVWLGRILLSFLCIYFILLKKYKMNKIDRLIITTIPIVVFISGSFTMSVFLVIILFTYFLPSIKKYFKFILYGFFVAASIIIISANVNVRDDSRKSFQVLGDIKDEGIIAITNYGGFNVRMLNTPLALQVGLLDKNFLGARLNPKSSTTYFNFLGNEFSRDHPNSNGTISGGLISTVYYYGFFGFIWIFAVMAPVFSKIGRNDKRAVICLLLLCFFEGSLSNPIFPYFLGLIYKLNFNQNYLNENRLKKIKKFS